MKAIRLGLHDKKLIFTCIYWHLCTYALCSSLKIRTCCMSLGKNRSSNERSPEMIVL